MYINDDVHALWWPIGGAHDDIYFQTEIDTAIENGETEDLEDIIGVDNIEEIDTEAVVPPPEVTILEPETSVDVNIEDADVLRVKFKINGRSIRRSILKQTRSLLELRQCAHV